MSHSFIDRNERALEMNNYNTQLIIESPININLTKWRPYIHINEWAFNGALVFVLSDDYKRTLSSHKHKTVSFLTKIYYGNPLTVIILLV